MYIEIWIVHMYMIVLLDHYSVADTCKTRTPCTVGGIEKFPFRFRATVLPFPCNGTKTVV